MANSVRWFLAAAAAAAALSGPAPAQTETLKKVSGNSVFGWYGFAVDNVGDVTGDGVLDFVVGAPAVNQTTGRARLHSGADGSQVFQWGGIHQNAMFGGVVAGIGDCDGDGIPETLVGVFFVSSVSPSYLRVFSGSSGSAIHTLQGADGKGFGTAVGRLGDIDADGKNDFIVGIPYANDVSQIGGRALVYSGWDASVVFTIDPVAAGENCGVAVAGIGDVNDDGVVDFAVGASHGSGDGGATFPGVARIYSGDDGALLYTVAGAVEGEEFGSAIAGGGDVNGDGVPDFAVGAFFANNNAGRAQVFSGKDGASLLKLKGGGGEGFGTSLAILGDVNGDARADVLVGSPNANKARVYSGAKGTPIATIAGKAQDGTGTSVASAGDVDGDGIPDLLVGAPHSDPTATFTYVGEARVLRFDGAIAPLKRKFCLQREIGGPDPDAFGTIQLATSKTAQSIQVNVGNLPVGMLDLFHLFLETAPGSGVFDDVGVLDIADAGKGKWSLALAWAGTPFQDLGIPYLAMLGGRIVEVRNAGSQVVLWGLLPASGANTKVKVALAPSMSGVPGSSGAVSLQFTGAAGNHKIDVTAKKLLANTTYTAWIEDSPGAGTFTQIGALAKGKLTLDTKKGDPLPLGAGSFAALAGLKAQIRDGATVVLEGTIP